MYKYAEIIQRYTVLIINPLAPNALFLYPLKTSENLTVFYCFEGVGALGTNGLISDPKVEDSLETKLMCELQRGVY